MTTLGEPLSKNRRWPVWLQTLASVRLTLVIIGLSMTLVVIGTLAQVAIGTFAAQKAFFNSFIVYNAWSPSIRIPIFPGGLTLGFLWLINLTAAFITRLHWREPGNFITHAGSCCSCWDNS